jgi:hypothetical protein
VARRRAEARRNHAARGEGVKPPGSPLIKPSITAPLGGLVAVEDLKVADRVDVAVVESDPDREHLRVVLIEALAGDEVPPE